MQPWHCVDTVETTPVACLRPVSSFKFAMQSPTKHAACATTSSERKHATALFIILPSCADQRLRGHLHPERDQHCEAERGHPLRLRPLDLLLEPLRLGNLALHHNFRDIRCPTLILLNSKTRILSLCQIFHCVKPL